jgi:hypothetical protein
MEEKGYIQGIFNYCDRWCEKCAFTARCRVYSTERLAQADLPSDPESPEFWNKLHDNFQKTLELLRDMLEEMEAKSKELEAREEKNDTADSKGYEKDAEDFDDELGPPPSVPWAEGYSKLIQDFFDKNEDFFSEEEERFDHKVRMGLPIDVEQLGFLQEALQTIRWFQDFISSKIHRAMAQKHYDTDGTETDNPQSDCNGSAKVAMIGIQRSTDAWQFIQRFFPEKDTETQKIRQLLEDIRTRLTTEFPHWEKFHRPGFDDAPEAVVRLDYNPN